MADLKGMDILGARDLSKSQIEKIMEEAEKFFPVASKEKQSEVLKGKVLASLFFEPSTRTRLSFETAMLRLGGRVITVSGEEGSSLSKGETLGDTARVVSQYADVIAVRSGREGSALEMAGSAEVPVINAGDGAGEHPTQALTDLFTIIKEKGSLDGLRIALVGDLKYGRTVHSLCYLLSHYDVELMFVSPEGLTMPEEIKNFLKEKGVAFKETVSLEDAVAKNDVVYMTRIQKERFSDLSEFEKLKNAYVLTAEMIKKHNAKIIIMHPLPRVGEISLNVDALPGAAYFRQVKNGVAVRMGLLNLVLNNK